ncbi:hypothetical protein UFOVP43_13 [uncultured Caudovirales phage]|uniref:Uncharacterized protein n=1 Tax=uncultured Caudovirales phage TaxID=2100421 RepID=A0A6J5KQC5_9CAUD|nr:hypothetical protein UFOVP43_13 [uncultured Caudovirales phage]
MAEFFSNYSGAQPQRTSLADMMNMASGVQQYQQAQQMNPLALRRAEMEIQQAQQMNPLAVKKAAAEAMVAEQTAPSRVAEQKAQTETAQTGANTAKLENAKKHLENVKRESIKLLSEKNLTRENIVNHYKSTLENMGGDEKALNQAISRIPQTNDSNALKTWVARDFTGALSAESQLERLFPTAQMLNTGTEQRPVSMGSALSFAAPGTQVGQGIENQLPPGTQVVNPATGASQLLGPASQRQPGQPLQTSVGPAQTQMFQAGGQTASSDWVDTTAKAANAANRIGTLQNIRNLSETAFTGVGGGRKELLAGIANAVGVPAYEMEKTATDELAKNSALLALAGGNTDAARALAEIANPNKKMNEGAIKGVVNQLIGVEKMNQAKAGYMAQFAKNPDVYNEKLQLFNKIADPRLFQEMSPADVAQLKRSMSDSEKKDLSQKIMQAKMLGIIK